MVFFKPRMGLHVQNRIRSIIFNNKIKYKSCSLVIVVILIFSTIFIGINVRSEDTNLDSSIILKISFKKPILNEMVLNNKTFTQLSVKNCLLHGKPGNPALPIYLAKILIPQGKKLKDIKIVNLDILELECNLINKPIIPQQPSITIDTTIEDAVFLMNNDIYNSSEPIVDNILTNIDVGYCRGYSILSLMINPVEYIPNKGKVYYYPEICIDITLDKNEKVNHFYRNNFNDEQWVKSLVYNPQETRNYNIKSSSINFEYSGGLCNSSDEYHYVIITTMNNSLDDWSTNLSIPYNWTSLMQNHSSKYGFNCTLVTIQEINNCSDYWNASALFNDTAAHIREFCRDAYQDWRTSYILIGGDDEWIPAREMNYSYESAVDSDLYWSNLDNTFNADEDSLWGEEGDTGFDLYSELYIGRLTCDEPQDVSNWMNKSFYYANSYDKNYLSKAAFYSGDTGWDCQGDDFIEYSALNGTSNWYGPIPGDHGEYPSWLGFNYGFKTWNKENPLMQFNLSVKWTAEPPNPGWKGGNEATAKTGLKNEINNNNVTLLSGIAHANSEMSLDVSANIWESDYYNTKPFFIHDYGCHCGDMDASDDGVLHSMLFHSDTELAFGCVFNTCYGWGSFSDTNSSSAVQQKLFWDYFFDITNNSGNISNWQLGKAMAYSKDSMAPTINWTYPGAPGSWRAIIQGCLLFGDPAQKIRILSNDSLYLYNETPPNGSTKINPLSNLSVYADNLYHGVLNATWWSNSSGDWIQFGNNYSINTINGAVNISQTNSNFSSYSTKYWWSVNLTKGNLWLNKTYRFITRSQYIPSPPSNFAATNYNKSRIDINWTNDGINKTYIEYNTSSDTWILGEGICLVNSTNTSYQHSNLNFGTTYYYQAWSWNDTDNCWSNTSRCDNATTHNTPPILTDENPLNGSTGIAKSTSTLSVSISDNGEDNFNWTIETCPCIGFNSENDSSSGIKSCSISGLSYSSTYYWYVNVTDGINSTNRTFRFTVENKPSGNGGNNGGSPPRPPQNIPPTANAGGPYFGNVNEVITFDGSNSFDINGNIVNFSWDFGDGRSGIGKKTTHIYTTPKNYTVILSVVDNYGAVDTDIVIASIIESIHNNSGSSQNNTKNNTSNEGNKTRDNDNDGLPNDIEKKLGSDVNSSSGVENITIDNITSFLVDTNGDGKVDLFYTPITGKKSLLKDQGNGLYLIDVDDDGDFDYSYDIIQDVLSPYESFSKIEKTKSYKFEIWQLIVVILFIMLLLLFFFKRKFS